MANIFEVVETNKRKSLLVMLGFTAFIAVTAILISQGLTTFLGIHTSPLAGMGIGLIISGVMSFTSYYWSDKLILSMSNAVPATKAQNLLFYSVVENLSIAAGIPMPKLYVINDSAMNAFATGRDPAHAAVCATSGLLFKMNRSELEGVIGHELSHVLNFDTRLMSVVTVMVGMITLLADWFNRSLWFGSGDSEGDRKGGNIAIVMAVIASILSPLVAQVIQRSISRRREYLADASSVILTRQPSGLISALKKLAADDEPLEVANKATAHLYISNPFKNAVGPLGRVSSLFDTHPPLAERIKALEAMS